MDAFVRNLRYGARVLVRAPGFTLVALLTLALGIGANTAIFTVVNGVLLRPLPWEDADRLVGLWESNPGRGWPQFSTSGPNFLDWVEQNRSFERMAGWRFLSFNLTGSGEAERIGGGAASADLLAMLGGQPVLGRGFLPEEDRPGGGARVAIIGHGLWKRRFGSDPGILDKGLTANGETYTVVGVLPDGFEWIGPTDLIVPLGPTLDENRGNHVIQTIGRLRPGVSEAQAREDMEEIALRLERLYPDSNAGWGVAMSTFYDWIIGPDLRRALLVLSGAVAAVLLIACANVASLMLARASTRRREIAIRTALGASRLRIVRQLLVECLLLSLAGGALGLLLAMWGVEALRALGPDSVPRLDETSLDGRAVAFTLVLSLITSVIFGLAPSLQASRADQHESLKEGGRGTPGVSGQQRLRGALVVIEVALSLVLLIGAGLLVRSFLRLQSVDPGFAAEGLLTMELNLPDSRYPAAPQKAAFYSQLIERVGGIPGVESAAAASILPFGPGNTAIEVQVEGRPPDAEGDAPSADWRMVTPEYFRTLRIPILKGRSIDLKDSAESELVIVISESMARRFWPDEDPIGRRIGPGSSDSRWTIVGVAEDVKTSGLDLETRPLMYLSSYQSSWNPMALAVRASGDPSVVLAAVRTTVRDLDKDVPVSNVRSMEEMISASVGPRRFNMLLLAIFSGVALGLAAVGIYGVMAFAVTQRTHEIGIRVALGAQRGSVIKMVVGQGLRLTLVGVAAGMLAALGLTRTLSSLLFEVTTTDPLTFMGIPLVLTGVALLACWLPARRATRVDPMVALRCE